MLLLWDTFKSFADSSSSSKIMIACYFFEQKAPRGMGKDKWVNQQSQTSPEGMLNVDGMIFVEVVEHYWAGLSRTCSTRFI